MNKNVLIGLVVVLLLAGGLFVMNRGSGDAGIGESAMQGDSKDGDAMMEGEKGALGEIQGNLQDLFAKGVAMQCDFSHSDENGTTVGDIYISGNTMRGDFELTPTSGEVVTSNMIRDENTTYVWSSELEQGLKMATPDVAVDETTSMESAAAQADPFTQLQDDNVSYNCSPWVVNQSMFTPPADVEFVDIAAQMEQFQQRFGN